MGIADKKKKHPMSIRFSTVDLNVINDAAYLRGQSRADFVREARDTGR
jgi:uncharacterized protein (DUF1778 family)